MTGRKMVMGTKAVVTSAHYLATQTGMKILQQGGNAFDAAIAVNAVLGVTQPHMCGFGGDGFLLLYVAKEKKVYSVNCSGTAPAKATRESFRSKGYTDIPKRGIYPVLIPGIVHGWLTCHEKYGRLKLPQLFEPAIEYAEAGFPISEQVSGWIDQLKDELIQFPSTSEIFLNGGRVPEPGSLLRQHDLAQTYRAIAQEGKEAFYRGRIAEAIVATSKSYDGLIEAKDLAEYHSHWEEPVKSSYRDATIYVSQPNSSSWTLSLELNMADLLDLASFTNESPDYHHYLVEIVKKAYPERNRYNTDPRFVAVPLDRILSPENAAKLFSRIDGKRAHRFQENSKFNRGDTTFFTVTDREGNIASSIQSIYFGFGSGIVAKGTGLVLTNRGAYFSLEDNHVNRLDPNKRTAHTLCACMVFKGDRPYISIGTMGGDGQPQSLLQLLTKIMDLKMNVQEAIESPRWLYGSVFRDAPEHNLNMEARFPKDLVEEMVRRGHSVKRMDDWTYHVGHAQGIVFNQETGVIMGGADPRGDGIALAW